MTETFKIKSIKYSIKRVEGNIFGPFYAGGNYELIIKVKVKYSDRFFLKNYTIRINGLDHPTYVEFGQVLGDSVLLEFLEDKMSNTIELESYVNTYIHKKAQEYYQEKRNKETAKRNSKTRDLESKKNIYEID